MTPLKSNSPTQPSLLCATTAGGNSAQLGGRPARRLVRNSSAQEHSRGRRLPRGTRRPTRKARLRRCLRNREPVSCRACRSAAPLSRHPTKTSTKPTSCRHPHYQILLRSNRCRCELDRLAHAKTDRVTATHLPGYGLSNQPLDAAYGYQLFADTLDAFLDSLGLRDVIASPDIQLKPMSRLAQG